MNSYVSPGSSEVIVVKQHTFQELTNEALLWKKSAISLFCFAVGGDWIHHLQAMGEQLRRYEEEHMTITAVRNGNGVLTNYVASLTDITTSKAVAEKIERLAFYDLLKDTIKWK